MSDCIDRQTIINLLTSRAETLKGLYGDLGGAVSGVRKLVQTLPSVKPEWKWIPVTEKLPWTDTNVLVMVLDDSGDTSWGYTSVGWLTPNGKYWVVDGELCYGVVAWMPLPEPWKEE